MKGGIRVVVEVNNESECNEDRGKGVRAGKNNRDEIVGGEVQKKRRKETN